MINLHLIEPVKGLPDMVFTANSAIVIRGSAVMGKFRHWQREPETKYFEKWFKENEFGLVRFDDLFEGTGDLLPWKDKLIGGHGIRSDLDGITKAAKFLSVLGREKDLVALKLINENFYHVDTCFCPMGERAIFYPKAFSADSIDVLLKMGAEPTSDRDAFMMAPNGVYLHKANSRTYDVLMCKPTYFEVNYAINPSMKKTLKDNTPVDPIKAMEQWNGLRQFYLKKDHKEQEFVVNDITDELRQKLESWGIDITINPTSEFQKSGGSNRCLSLFL